MLSDKDREDLIHMVKTTEAVDPTDLVGFFEDKFDVNNPINEDILHIMVIVANNSAESKGVDLIASMMAHRPEVYASIVELLSSIILSPDGTVAVDGFFDLYARVVSYEKDRSV